MGTAMPSRNPDTLAGRFPKATSPTTICPNCSRATLEFPPIDRLLSIDDAAAFYSVHRGTIRNWIKYGWIRAFRPHNEAKQIRVALTDLMRLDSSFGTKDSITRAKSYQSQKQKQARAASKALECDAQPADNK